MFPQSQGVPNHTATARDNPLLKLSRRTVPGDISRDPVNRDLHSINSQTTQLNTLMDWDPQIPGDPLSLQPPELPINGSDFDSDGEPRLPPSLAEYNLPTDFNPRFWDKGPEPEPSSGKKRKASTEATDATSHKHERTEKSSEIPTLHDSSIAEQMAAVQSNINRMKRISANLATQTSRLDKVVSSGEQYYRNLEKLSKDSIKDLDDLITDLCPADPSSSASDSDQSSPPVSAQLTSLLPFPADQHAAPAPASSENSPEESPMHSGDQMPYANLFAPLVLSTQTQPPMPSTAAESEQGAPPAIIQQHELKLSAPPPFDQRALQITLSVSIDVTRQTIIRLIPVNKFGIPYTLVKWIDARLASELFKQDISGLAWGICQFWEAMTCRAHLWCRLDAWLDQTQGVDYSPDTDLQDTRPRDPASNIDRSWLGFKLGGGQVELHGLFMCNIIIDPWTGQAGLQPEVVLEGGGHNFQTIHKTGRDLFRACLPLHEDNTPLTAGEIVTAVEVWHRSLQHSINAATRNLP